MLIKKADDQSGRIQRLEQLAAGNGPDAGRYAVELRNRRAGLRGERDAAYLIDFDFAESLNWAVIHDLQLEHGGHTAQIDHLLINRWMQVYVLETKSFHSGLKINDAGEFLRWNDFAKRFEGMPSPLAQNDRHIEVLRAVFDGLELPTRAGFRIQPDFMSFVLVSPNARIDRPKEFDTSRVIKADVLRKSIWKDIDNENPVIGLLKTAAKVVSGETVRTVAKSLAAKHRPTQLAEAPSSPNETTHRVTPEATRDGPPKSSQTRYERAQVDSLICKSCSATAGTILYGKYGYYFKCEPCGANTAIRLKCPAGHTEKLRKEGMNFYRACEHCNTTSLFFTNNSQ